MLDWLKSELAGEDAFEVLVEVQSGPTTWITYRGPLLAVDASGLVMLVETVDEGDLRMCLRWDRIVHVALRYV